MIVGARVVLVPMAAEHLDELGEMFEHPELAAAWPGDNRARFAERLAADDDGVGFVVTVGGRTVGFIQYWEEDDPNYLSASIDVALHPEWCNQGLGTDAVRTLARWLFDERGHHRLQIDPRATNARAIASYRKVGFRDVGIMRQYELGNDGVWHDGLLMDLLPDELR